MKWALVAHLERSVVFPTVMRAIAAHTTSFYRPIISFNSSRYSDTLLRFRFRASRANNERVLVASTILIILRYTTHTYVVLAGCIKKSREFNRDRSNRTRGWRSVSSTNKCSLLLATERRVLVECPAERKPSVGSAFSVYLRLNTMFKAVFNLGI